MASRPIPLAYKNGALVYKYGGQITIYGAQITTDFICSMTWDRIGHSGVMESFIEKCRWLFVRYEITMNPSTFTAY